MYPNEGLVCNASCLLRAMGLTSSPAVRAALGQGSHSANTREHLPLKLHWKWPHPILNTESSMRCEQGVSAEQQPRLVAAMASAAARYGHVMHPETATEPTVELAERLLHSAGQGWASRVFFSDDGYVPGRIRC